MNQIWILRNMVFFIKIIRNINNFLVTTVFNGSQIILSDRVLLTFVLKLSKYILLTQKGHISIKARKKCLPLEEMQPLVYSIYSFQLIVAYILNYTLTSYISYFCRTDIVPFP